MGKISSGGFQPPHLLQIIRFATDSVVRLLYLGLIVSWSFYRYILDIYDSCALG